MTQKKPTIKQTNKQDIQLDFNRFGMKANQHKPKHVLK